MKQFLILQKIFVLILLTSLVFSCQTGTKTPAASIPINKTPSETPGLTPNKAPTEIQSEPYPLEGPGFYKVGIRRNISFKDPDRGDREVSITVWYPAVVEGKTGKTENPDAAVDISGAPYPLILSSSKVGFIFAPHLASHGFVVLGINKIDSSSYWGEWLIDFPMDILFALRQVAAGSIPELDGIIDSSQAGVMGYSFDGYDALAMSGARIEPKYYLGQCTKYNTFDPKPPAWWIDYICKMSKTWPEFEAHAAEWMKESTDGLWQPMTDERIKAVMPMAPEGAWLFGNRGLAAADRPILIIAAEKDDINIYGLEATFIFNNMGSAEKSMVTFMGKDHMMVYDSRSVARMAHFATAFFGYHLQGKNDYAHYFSEEFVKQHNELTWGAVKKEN
jgi:predicted dienelactone hydrolase